MSRLRNLWQAILGFRIYSYLVFLIRFLASRAETGILAQEAPKAPESRPLADLLSSATAPPAGPVGSHAELTQRGCKLNAGSWRFPLMVLAEFSELC